MAEHTRSTPLDIQPVSNNSEDWKPSTGMITVRTVKTARITPDPAFQMRSEGTDPDVVEKYAGIMKESDPDGWAQFPLIRVFLSTDSLPDVSEAKDRDQFSDMLDDTDDQYKIVSGFHRFEAIQQNGYDEIRVELMYGDETEALIAALGQNADRSQPRTQDDIRKMMEFCLTHPEISQWSNNQIAHWCAVAHQTVNNHELRMLDEGSTANLAIQNRPDKLKFLDRHGNISLRKRTAPKPKEPSIGDGLAINPKGEVIEAVEPAMDAEGVERDKLLRDIEGEYNDEVRDFIFHTEQTVMNQREADLIENYPVMERYPRRAGLSLEDLREFKDQLYAVVHDLNQRKVTVGQEMTALFEKEIKSLFPDDMNWSQITEWKEAVADAFPQLKGKLYELSYYDRLRIKNAIPTVAEQLKKTGIDAYLPSDYGAEAEEEEDPHEVLYKSVRDLRNDVEKEIIANVYDGEVVISKTDVARKIFLEGFNKAYPDDKLSMKRAQHNSWELDELEDDALLKLKVYWQKVQKAAIRTPRPQWVDDCVHSFKCQLTAIKFSASRDYDAVGRAMNLVPDSPLTDEESEEIVKAAHAAAKAKADEIHSRHKEDN